ncbi:MAG: N-acetylmuramoyl-L-alanine amidase, family 2 [Nocardioides sp.]|nr:N-acetylmuramoyl-L-alanine amidase, family 2 [Nocardioides sp.]
MSPIKSRYTTACQQLLALGVVIAALTPAASIVSLDVVREDPGAAQSNVVRGDLSAYSRATRQKSVVPTEVVDPTVTEYSLTAPTGAKTVTGGLQARTKAGGIAGSTELVSRPQAVTGDTLVGVTWQHGVQVAEADISLEVRTLKDDAWSDWTKLEYHDDHGPDPDSREARRARPGTDELIVGNVDQVQVRADTAGAIPPDMKLAVVDPGVATKTADELPALDTAKLDSADGSAGSVAGAPAAAPSVEADGTDALDPMAATYTPKPVIYSRAQWGADERLRDKSSLHYSEVHAGFVHHTVNANDYTKAEVPGILRSIYAYHTQSRGWSDIGYNFLVDRFGRIWEGRFGGIDRPVVGAHTLNYNDYAFAMSAIGNYDIKQPSGAMVQAYGALFAWKLSLHGVDASSTKQWVGSRYFEAIQGHRDAASTACPGKYLYARIPKIRQLAAEAQQGWSGRELESNIASTPHPDLVVRRASDGMAFVLPTGGLTELKPAATISTGWSGAGKVIASPDLTGDGRADLVVQAADGSSDVRPGIGKGRFGDLVKPTNALVGHDLVTAVGDLNGDGDNDLVARDTATGRLDAYVGGGAGGFNRKKVGEGWGDYNLLVGTGDLNGDGKVDVLARDSVGRLWLRPGSGGVKLGDPIRVAGSWKAFDTITGYGDYNADGRVDLFVRRADTKDGYVVPGRGDGTFGHALGPLARIRKFTDVTGGGQIAGNAAPDLIARDGDRLVLVRNAGTVDLGKPIATGADLSSADVLLNAGDWDRDGFGDIVTRNKNNGKLYLRRGDGQGHFGDAVSIGAGFGGVGLLAAVGDMTGDGWPDLMGQPKGGDIRIYPGRGLDGLKASYVAHSPIDAGRQISVGRWDGDGAPDNLFRKDSRLTLYPGNGPGGLTTGKPLSLDVTPYDWVIGVSDVRLTGHPDIIVRAKKTGYLWLVPATGNGFRERRFLGEGMEQFDLAG